MPSAVLICRTEETALDFVCRYSCPREAWNRHHSDDENDENHNQEFDRRESPLVLSRTSLVPALTRPLDVSRATRGSLFEPSCWETIDPSTSNSRTVPASRSSTYGVNRETVFARHGKPIWQCPARKNGGKPSFPPWKEPTKEFSCRRAASDWWHKRCHQARMLRRSGLA